VKYQSAAPFFLYGSASGFDRQDNAASGIFKQTLRRPDLTSVLFRVFDEEYISRTIDNSVFSDNPDWNQFVVDSFANNEPSQLPGCYLVCLKDVFINNHVIYFGGSAETTMLYEMHWPPDRPSTPINHSVHLRHNTKINSFADDHVYFYLGGAGSTNYGHWLTDDLPRLAAIERYLEINPGSAVRILITESRIPRVDEARRDTLARHPKLSGVAVEFIDPGVVYHIDRILYATPVSYHPIAKLRAGIRYVRNTYGRSEGRGARRIYMTRPPSSARRVSNGEEIEAYLRERGFETFDAGSMNFEEQVAVFSNAAVVVGVMGAAMTNCIFSAPATSVVHLSCKGWQEPYFWDLADACGQDYACVYGQPANGETTAHLAPFHIDLEYLETALNRLT
jgi:hypothetical protein